MRNEHMFCAEGKCVDLTLSNCNGFSKKGNQIECEELKRVI